MSPIHIRNIHIQYTEASPAIDNFQNTFRGIETTIFNVNVLKIYF